jgi:mono/diheme cytochrome c family protein
MLETGQFVVAQILIGRGKTPAFADKLPDEQIAAVRPIHSQSMGNDFGPVTPQNVAELRELMKRASQTAARVSQSQK